MSKKGGGAKKKAAGGGELSSYLESYLQTINETIVTSPIPRRNLPADS
jgi:hypothetical protein